MNKKLLDLSSEEAKEFFLSGSRYCTFDLPIYFTFNKLLKRISEELDTKNLSDYYKNKKPYKYDNVNYNLFTNKDGEYSWRLFQLIHPAIYVSLVHEITKEGYWKEIKEHLLKETKIECASIPVVENGNKKEKEKQILTWWEEIEQKSISLALDYNYIFITDITDCYGSIYTHSIPWALHSKETAKKNKRNVNFLGNIIDKHIRNMSYGQTNGIPQGSILMDLIAEIVLKYADIELSEKINSLVDFKIIRYRDDYRIFVNNPEIGKRIIKELSNVLADLGMKLNAIKTIQSDDVINNSIKPDKLYWLLHYSENKDPAKQLLIIKNLADRYRNSGILIRVLSEFYKKIYKYKNEEIRNVDVLISIITDIALKNPRTYPVSVSMLGKFFSKLGDKEKEKYIEKVVNKFKAVPNTEILDLWLQRLTINSGIKIDEINTGKLYKKVIDKETEIWNSKWLKGKLAKIIKETDIIDREKLRRLSDYPELEEVLLFVKKLY